MKAAQEGKEMKTAQEIIKVLAQECAYAYYCKMRCEASPMSFTGGVRAGSWDTALRLLSEATDEPEVVIILVLSKLWESREWKAAPELVDEFTHQFLDHYDSGADAPESAEDA